ncbi:MAG: sugar ABC transporter substrate-binding protein [Candidatus Methanomethyliaceae archaeon]
MKRYSFLSVALVGLILIPLVAFPTLPVAAQGLSPEFEKFKGKYTEEYLLWIASIKEKYGGTTLNLAGFAHPGLEAIKKMTPDFEALSGIKVTYDETDIAKLHDKVVLDVTSGSKKYDLLMTPEVLAPEFWHLGYMEPLNPWLEDKMAVKTPEGFDYADLHPGYTMMFTDFKDKNIYAIPITGEVALLMYRKDLFEKYGKNVPKTYDELYELAKFFTDQNIVEDGKRVYGISFRGRPALGGANWVFSILVFGFGGTLVDPADHQTPTLTKNREAAIKTIEYEIKLAQVGVPGIPAFDPYDAVNQFRQGFAAMCIEASVLAPATSDPAQTPVADKVAYAALPAGPAGSYNATFSHGIGMTSFSKNKEAAYAFLVWMLGRANQDLYLAYGGSPVRYSGLRDPINQARYPYLEATLQGLDQAAALYQAGLVGPTPQTEHVLQFINVWAVNVSRALSGEISAEQAVDNIQREMEEIVSK